MGRKRKIIFWIASSVAVALLTTRFIQNYRSHARPVVLTGAVIRKDADPRKQLPIANARVSVAGGDADESATSDASGLFKLPLHPFITSWRMTLRFEHADYQPLEIDAGDKGQLYVVRMEPLVRESVVQPDHAATAKAVPVANVRIRYSVKDQTTISVGSMAKQFEVVNSRDVPCRGQRPCSPDGKWKAAIGKLTLDADKGNEFRNVRVSCIAGPCPFTKLETNDLSNPSRKLQITALDWSDTASFLVEAEVTRTMTTDMVRQFYPFIVGETISFALPAAAEGPCLIADLNGEPIVFPLGPNLSMSWTACSLQDAQGSKVYRCEIKPGYQVRQ